LSVTWAVGSADPAPHASRPYAPPTTWHPTQQQRQRIPGANTGQALSTLLCPTASGLPSPRQRPPARLSQPPRSSSSRPPASAVDICHGGASFPRAPPSPPPPSHGIAARLSLGLLDRETSRASRGSERGPCPATLYGSCLLVRAPCHSQPRPHRCQCSRSRALALRGAP